MCFYAIQQEIKEQIQKHYADLNPCVIPLPQTQELRGIISSIDPIFADADLLLKHFDALQNLKESKRSLHVILCCHILEGYGDVICLKRIAAELKKRRPQWNIQSLAVLKDSERKIAQTFASPVEIVTSLEEQQITRFKEADVIVEVPTLHPQMRTKSHLKIGEYSASKYAPFHPSSGNYCFGLQFFELGILLPFEEPALTPPWTQEILKREAPNRSHFAYLRTEEGLRHFLTLLRKERGNKQLVFVYSIEQLMFAMNELEKNGDAGEIRVYAGESFAKKSLKSKGSIWVLVAIFSMSVEEFRGIIKVSTGLIGVTGDQSLSDAISLQKPFYLEAAHKKEMQIDLINLQKQEGFMHLVDLYDERKALNHLLLVKEAKRFSSFMQAHFDAMRYLPKLIENAKKT